LKLQGKMGTIIIIDHKKRRSNKKAAKFEKHQKKFVQKLKWIKKLTSKFENNSTKGHKTWKWVKRIGMKNRI